MKIVFKDIGINPFIPNKKCGADPVSAAIMGGAGLVGNVLGVASSSSNVSSQLSAQSRENAINRAWQTEEAEKARQYNTSERVATQDWQKQMLDYQNQYNSPTHQAAMMRDAGLNPNIALGGQGAIVSANPSQGSPQSSPLPSGVGGLSPVGFQPLDLQIPQLLNGIGGFMKNIGEAEKLGIDTDYAKASFNMNLRKLSAESSLQEFYAAGEKLTQSIRYGIKDKLVAKALDECQKTHWEAILMEKKGISEDLQQRVLESQEKLNEAVANYNGQNAELLKLDVEHYEEAFNQRMAIGRSEIVSNYANAENSRASADQTKIFNKIYGDERYKHSLISQAVEAGRKAVSDSKLSKKQAEHMTYLVEQAAYANDMKEFTYWTGQINQFVNTVGSAASQFYGAGALRELINIRQQQGKPSLLSGNDYYMDGGLLFKK